MRNLSSSQINILVGTSINRGKQKKKKVGEGVSNKIHFALETVIMDSTQQTENKFPKYAQRLSFHDVFHITETVDLICPREVWP